MRKNFNSIEIAIAKSVSIYRALPDQSGWTLCEDGTYINGAIKLKRNRYYHLDVPGDKGHSSIDFFVDVVGMKFIDSMNHLLSVSTGKVWR